MNQELFYSLVGLALFTIGLAGLMIVPNIIRKLVALNIMGMGVFMIFLSTAQHETVTDPLPHAMVLTGIVVAVAGTALCLWLALRINQIDKTEASH